MKFWIVFTLLLATGACERGGHAFLGFTARHRNDRYHHRADR